MFDDFMHIVGFLVWGWLGFYFGRYYGENIYRFFRYWRLRFIRTCVQRRNRVKPEQIILGR